MYKNGAGWDLGDLFLLVLIAYEVSYLTLMTSVFPSVLSLVEIICDQLIVMILSHLACMHCAFRAAYCY